MGNNKFIKEESVTRRGTYQCNIYQARKQKIRGRNSCTNRSKMGIKKLPENWQTAIIIIIIFSGTAAQHGL
jgi:hypothetical protein